MDLPEDFKELLLLFNSRNVEFLIVGGYALGFHGVPRYTGDLDILVARSIENANGILEAISDFGMKSLGLVQADFTTPGNVIQIGYPPIRVDLLTEISGVEWADAWDNRVFAEMNGIPVYIISRENLIKNKRAVGRPVDLGDLDRLLN